MPPAHRLPAPRGLALALLVLALLLPSGGLAQNVDAAAPQPSDECGGRPLHPPIHIGGYVGPTGFVVGHDPLTGEPVPRPGTGVTRGDGTADDPYVIEGWCILGGAPGTGILPRHGIRLFDTHAHVVVRDNVIVHARYGVSLRDATNVTVEENALRGNLYALYLDGSHGIVLRANDLLEARSGVTLYRSSANSVLDNRIPGAYEAGIHLQGSHDNEIRGNVVSGDARAAFDVIGVDDLAGDRNRFAENVVTETSGAGISLAYTDHALVEDNHLARNRIGVYSSWASATALHNNLVEDNLQHGLELFGYDRGIRIVDNVVRGNGGGGIHFDYDSKPRGDNVVRGNNIAQNVGGGLVEGYHSTIDARENWWGCIEGPEEAACDAVIGEAVAFEPWLTEPNVNAGVRT